MHDLFQLLVNWRVRAQTQDQDGFALSEHEYIVDDCANGLVHVTEVPQSELPARPPNVLRKGII